MPSFPKLRIALLATTAIVAFSGVSHAQTTTDKSSISVPSANPATKADPDMAKVLAALNAGDPAKVAIVGESAGGNLAVATAIAARDQKLTAPVAVIAVYPIATTAMDTPSKVEDAAAKPLSTPMMAWFFDKVLHNAGEKQDPRLNLVAADLKGLPPTTIINAEIDPLRSDGDMLADKMKSAGNDVTHKVYAGVAHEFFGMDAVVAKAKEAQDFAVSQLQKSFGLPSSTVGTSPSRQ